MKPIWTHADTPPEADAKATKTTVDEAETHPPVGAGLGVERLVQNYQAIIKARAIFYPVAYRFGRELGRGRQGVVFLVFRHGSRGCVTRHAIKLFDPSIYKNTPMYWTDMGRIAAQLSRLQQVNSPNLVGRDLYEESNGIGYIQMEAIDGLDVHELLYGNHFEQVRRNVTARKWKQFGSTIFRFEEGKVRIQPGVALYLMRQSLRGLEALHNAGFVHCDIKPANIMCNKLGHAKLVDYGRANFIDEKVSFLLGSPLYMAPEIHRREFYRVASDIYSVGLVGLEMLRGEPLADYSRMSETELLDLKMELPSRLEALLPDHVRKNSDFVSLLERFVHPDPDERFASAEVAESRSGGLAQLHQQLTLMGKDSEYDRDLEEYLSVLYPTRGNRDPDRHEGLIA